MTTRRSFLGSLLAAAAAPAFVRAQSLMPVAPRIWTPPSGLYLFSSAFVSGPDTVTVVQHFSDATLATERRMPGVAVGDQVFIATDSDGSFAPLRIKVLKTGPSFNMLPNAGFANRAAAWGASA